MCLWNGPPTLIGREQKNGSQSWLVDNKNPPLPALNLSLRIFFLRLFFLSAISPQSVNENLFLTLLFLSSIIIPIHICWNSFPKVTGMLTWLLFSPQICHFGSRPSFRTRPIFCQTLRLWTFENYLLVESAFVARNSRTLFSKLYHPCFLKIHKFYHFTSPFQLMCLGLCFNQVCVQMWF